MRYKERKKALSVVTDRARAETLYHLVYYHVSKQTLFLSLMRNGSNVIIARRYLSDECSSQLQNTI